MAVSLFRSDPGASHDEAGHGAASGFRTRIGEVAGQGVRFELYQFNRKSHLLAQGVAPAAAGTPAPIVPGHLATARQVRIVLDGGAALLEPGALQYASGQLQVDMQKNAGAGGMFSRAIQSAGSGESAFATRFAGQGEVWTEANPGHFLLAQMDGADDALILDDRAFYACDGNVAVSTHTHRSVAGLFSGNGLMQPKLTGAGAIVVECPVPVGEVEAVELDGGGEMIVDGDVMLMYSASLEVELRPLVTGLRNTMRSGEGLVFVFRGRGTVWLTPTKRLGF